MANYQLLKADIDAKVYENARRKITGANLNSVLNAMVTTLGTGYQFAGVATIATNPGTPDAKVFYIANGKGVYTNFGGININEDGVFLLVYNDTWTKLLAASLADSSVTTPKIADAAITKEKIEDEAVATDKIASAAVTAEKLDGVIRDKIGAAIVHPIELTYAELKALRDAKKLIAGQAYRVTDFVTTSVQADTRSAGHPFDIIVVADDEGTLNENAKACKHDGDTYFNDCKLEAWELKYCLDNDTDRCAWADATNGKGVVWWMKDEWDNECFYDFKNIQYKRYKVTAIDNPHIPDDAKAAFIYNEETQPFYFGAEDFFGNSFPNTATWDKANPMWVYRFTGYDAVERTWYDMSTKHLSLSAEALEFLANDDSGTDTVDLCRMNREGVFVNEFFSDGLYYKGRNVLPNNVGYGIHKETWEDGALSDYYVCYQCNNTIGNNCQANTFGNNCYSNTFGNNCYCNTFGNNCYRNTFGNDCQTNIFGNDCSSNSFGNDCRSNSFGNYCYSNSFGNYCRSNSFGNYCYSNSFGNYCYSNSFGNYCYSNSFGNYCYSNSFGNDCYSNSFGNNCSSNSFGNNCSSNSFGNDCSYIKFASTNSATTKYDYYQYNRFGGGCKYILFKGAETASSSAQVMNYNFNQGLQGTTRAYLTIDGVRGRAYETKVAKNSKGEIKQYCEADLIN